MFFQSLLWIPGTIVMFFLLRWIAVKFVQVWMPSTAKEMAQEQLHHELERLETVKIRLESKKIECGIADEELKLEKKIEATQVKINKLKLNIGVLDDESKNNGDSHSDRPHHSRHIWR